MSSAAPTIQDIAIEAGVSASTVSRALRGDNRISKTTAAKVKATAEKLGYRPNPLISVLMAHLRTTKHIDYQSTIAYIDMSLNPVETEKWSSSKQYYESICKRADQLGYGIDRFWFYETDITPKQLLKILLSRGIQGAIIHYFPEHNNQTHEFPLDLSSLAVASIGSKIDNPFLHFSSTDHYEVVKLAFERLLERGYTKIGLALDSYTDNLTKGRFLGAYLNAQQAVRSKDRLEYLISDKFNRDTFLSWYSSIKPDSIIYINDIILAWLKESNVLVPEQVGLVHLDQPAHLPQISGIKQRHDAVAATTVDLIVGQLYHNERGIPQAPKAVLIHGAWHEGETVRKLI